MLPPLAGYTATGMPGLLGLPPLPALSAANPSMAALPPPPRYPSRPSGPLPPMLAASASLPVPGTPPAPQTPPTAQTPPKALAPGQHQQALGKPPQPGPGADGDLERTVLPGQFSSDAEFGAPPPEERSQQANATYDVEQEE